MLLSRRMTITSGFDVDVTISWEWVTVIRSAAPRITWILERMFSADSKAGTHTALHGARPRSRARCQNRGRSKIPDKSPSVTPRSPGLQRSRWLLYRADASWLASRKIWGIGWSHSRHAHVTPNLNRCSERY
jgi:hypothetical protein